MSIAQIPRQLWNDLWVHQRDAISFAWPYLRKPGRPPTALIRMPTGTGKTGVIAVLSVAAPPDGWTLILTPWANLCDQMVKDIRLRFWLRTEWKPSKKPKVVRLFPSSLDEVLQNKSEPHLIVVATFATIVSIFREDREKYLQISDKLAQVFVDEGHYEPAVEWGQAVKGLHKPTVLLTATPYRNDLKLFRIAKNDVHHFTHQAAERKAIVRPVEIRPLGVDEPSYDQLAAWCGKFSAFWKGREKTRLHRTPRAIVCCSRMATVERVTRLLREKGINAVGIHDRFGSAKEGWLLTNTPDPRTVNYEVWVHQNKLTEGLDDERFCVLALVNVIGNDRKLVQQIGRVLRRGPKKTGRALILHSDDINVNRSWENYRKFEVQPNLVDPERYRQFLNSALSSQPEFEYFGRRFRSRFESDGANLPASVMLPASVVVRRVKPKFTMREFAEFTSDSLLLEDRILLGPAAEPIVGPNESRLWVYAIFGNSPILIEHSQYEIRLGAMVAALHDDLLFVADTEGFYPVEYLADCTRRVGSDELGRVLGRRTIPKEVTLINAWPAGPTVRRSNIYADDLSNTPAQLTDAVFVCRGVRATVLPERKGDLSHRHYIGFQRSRISEQLRILDRSSFDVDSFVDWTKRLADMIQDPKRALPDFFRRYLSPVAPPPVVSPRFLVFNLFEGDIEIQGDDSTEIELVETVAELRGGVSTNGQSLQSEFGIRFRLLDEETEYTADAALIYDPGSARFRLSGDNLNTRIFVSHAGSDEADGLVTYLNKNDEGFTVVLDSPDTYYSSGFFYKIDYSFAESWIAALMTPVDLLRSSTSEKGEKTKGTRTWDRLSVFGIIDRRTRTALIPREFGRSEFLICDDLNKEVADFVCASFSDHKIAFIHAKHSDDRNVSASALHDVVAQAMKNLSVVTRGGNAPGNLERWNRNALWSATDIKRWRIGRRNLPVQEALWQRIRNEILDHPDGKKEVWLVVGQTLDKGMFIEQLRNPDTRDAVTGQVVHLLSGLNAQCTQLNVQLRVFCHSSP